MTAENKKSGFVPLWRSLLSWEWHDDPNVLSVWVHLLLLASFHPSRWRGREVKPGQVITSPEKLATKTGLTRQKVRTVLEKLRLSKEITTEATNSFTVVTICKYKEYNVSEFWSNQLSNQQITIEQPTDNQRITNEQPHSKNVKECREGKEKKDGEKSPRSKTFKQWTEQEFLNDIDNHCKGHPEREAVKVAFFEYWSEGPGKMLFQRKQTWDTGRRLSTWIRNNQNRMPLFQDKQKPSAGGHGKSLNLGV